MLSVRPNGPSNNRPLGRFQLDLGRFCAVGRAWSSPPARAPAPRAGGDLGEVLQLGEPSVRYLSKPPTPPCETAPSHTGGGAGESVWRLGVVLAEELRRLGRTLRKPGFLKDRRDLGVRREAFHPASSQSKIAQTRSLSFGSRKTCDPLQPCCFRFSAPLVEKVFQKRSKSSIFTVARTISLLLC